MPVYQQDKSKPEPWCCRYDYEACESAPANKMMDNLNAFVADASNVGKSYSSGDKTYTIAKIDNFSYTDPVDNSVSKNQVGGILHRSQDLFVTAPWWGRKEVGKK